MEATNDDCSEPIFTPDQRIRVFVSSTLEELAPERASARQAIESLRFIPVLFELGARPHPPRALYRAYLDQSQVFVGVYWQRYGWVAPGTEISGIEDEYVLAARLPRLIYVKRPAPDREPRLHELLDRIGADGSSYRRFETARELGKLLADDLALLVSERFVRAGEPGRRHRVLIPSPASSFVGREHELGSLVDLLRRPDVRLVTLTGTGGIGKTRLALEAARRVADDFDDGVVTVQLASLRDPLDVLPAIAEALEVSARPDESPLVSLQTHLAARHVLLVLDNMEQVHAAAPAVGNLLVAAPGLRVLVSSRVRLGISGEHCFQVTPLGLPTPGEQDLVALERSDAARLFTTRAEAAGWRATESDAPIIAEIVRRLDGLPLAIELAAAQARLGPAELIHARLRRRLDLAGGPRDAEKRHRTLRDSIAWSYDLLDEAARRFFETLSIFSGGFSMEAAGAVAESRDDVEELLASLVDASLLTTGPSRVAGARFGMLETIREYAAERLEEHGGRAEAARRHIAYFADLADEAYGAGVDTLLAAHILQDEERDNLRAALQAAIVLAPAEGLRLAGALEHLWSSRGLAREGRQAIGRALAAAPDAPTEARARALLSDAWLAAEQGACSEADRLALQALELFRDLGDVRNEGEALNALGWSAERQGDAERALGYFEESHLAFSKLSDESLRVMTTVQLAKWLAMSGDLDQARRRYLEALRTFELHGLDDARAALLIHLGDIDVQAGDLASARRSYEASREIARRIENKRVLASSLGALAQVDAADERIAEAACSYSEAFEIHSELGDRIGAAYSLERLAAVAHSCGGVEAAARLIGAARAQRAVGNVAASPAEADEVEEVMRAVRGELGDERLAQEASLGGALGAADLLALVRRVVTQASSEPSVTP